MYHFLQMGSRHAIVAIALAGCGRFGFDPIVAGDDDAGPAISVELPGGGTIRKVTSGRDGTWYAMSERGQGYRSDDGQSWLACGDRRITAIAVGSDGTVYGSGMQVGISTDRCASWTSSTLDRFSDHIAADGAEVFALADRGLRRRTGTTWTAVPTPLDGGRFVAYGGRPGTSRLAAVAGMGVVVSSTGTSWTAVTTGFPNLAFAQVAVSPTRMYAIHSAGIPPGGISCSDGTGLTWTTCSPQSGLAIAVDPLNDQHVVAAIYDSLGETFTGFQSLQLDRREQVGLDAANIYDLHFLPSGALLSASTRGVFFSPAGPLAFQPRSTGLDAWNVYGIFRDGDDVYLGTEAGVLRSRAGSPYTISTTGQRFSTRTRELLRAFDGSLIASGRAVWRSVDDGQTWEILNSPGLDDNYNIDALAVVGTRLFAGTNERLIYADPPWTTWTPHVVGGVRQNLHAIVPVATELWLATEKGVYVSTDQGASFTRIAAVTARCRELIALADGSLAAGCDDGVWITDPARTSWQPRGLTAVDTHALLATATWLIAATTSGLHASADRGGAWTELAGSAGLDLRSVAVDDDGSIVFGGVGTGLRRTTLP